MTEIAAARERVVFAIRELELLMRMAGHHGLDREDIAAVSTLSADDLARIADALRIDAPPPR